MRGERAVDACDAFVPRRFGAADDAAVGFLEREVRGVPFRGWGAGGPGAGVDGAGIGFHPGHGWVRAGLGVPGAGVDESGTVGGAIVFGMG